MATSVSAPGNATATATPARDWAAVVHLLHVSRALDQLEEQVLVPQKKVIYQFSARGHDLAQILLGQRLTHPHDGACGYYRSRPLLLALGVPLDEALGSSMARAGGYSDGRDIGVVFNYPNPNGPSALPMCGGVGSQYTPTVGWAQAVEYRERVLGDATYAGAVGVVLGGDASVATNGFWSALTIATTQKLPVFFFIEDNGYGISVPGTFQTPGADIAANLASFATSTCSAVMARSRPKPPASSMRRLPMCGRAKGRACCACACRGSKATASRTPRPTSRRKPSPRNGRAIRCRS